MGMESWWLSLTDDQRSQCRSAFEYAINSSPDVVDKTNISDSTMSKQSLLRLFATAAMDTDFKESLFQMAENEAVRVGDYAELHYIYLAWWNMYKRLWKQDPNYFQKLEECLKKDMAIHEIFYEKIKAEGWRTLPGYPAFKELALLYERIGNIESAILVVEDAIARSVVEETSFERRLSRLRKMKEKTDGCRH
ncbi:hypothetical protein G3578_10200 [Brevibacillus sp. SYP-B805]|uniref:hypothetical protein n=1 Tax=Brevibacillus sp. SYP-B805 TaxID=1578199 RepID=UPI0013F9640F|nr:hypothetical protein [Brevibacillus sp. SYP-B805]NGQ95524.1 hypothetical protein [Brevibacillus sp. SYP-B805]